MSRIIRDAECFEKTGLSNERRRQLEHDGLFPRRFKLVPGTGHRSHRGILNDGFVVGGNESIRTEGGSKVSRCPIAAGRGFAGDECERAEFFDRDRRVLSQLREMRVVLSASQYMGRLKPDAPGRWPPRRRGLPVSKRRMPSQFRLRFEVSEFGPCCVRHYNSPG